MQGIGGDIHGYFEWLALEVPQNIELRIASVHEILDESKKSESFYKIVQELIGMKAFDKALNVAVAISDECFKVKALLDIFEQLDEEGQDLKALQLINNALALAHESLCAELRVEALGEISKRLAKRGKIQIALTVANDIQDVPEKDGALFIVSIELVESEQMERAVATARMISDLSDEKIEVFYLIFERLAEMGQIGEALQLLDEILALANALPDEEEKITWFIAICKQLEAMNQIKEAVKAINSILKIANAIPQICRQVEVFCKVSSRLVAMGLSRQALKVIVHILKIAYLVDDEGWKAGVFCRISRQFMQLHRSDWAIKFAKSIPNEDSKSLVFSQISRQFVQMGQSQEAQEVANLIINPFVKADAFLRIAGKA